MKPVFFSNQADFRQWLEANHLNENELIAGFYKVNSGKPSMTWSESVDQALCFGWIDGVRRSIDSESYCIRFTPRRSTSNWSEINIQKMKVLTENGLMQPAGLEAFSKRNEEKSAVYSFESNTKELPDWLKNKLTANPVAWDFFSSQAPSYQKVIVHWIQSAKLEKTKLSRLEKLILESEKQKRLI